MKITEIEALDRPKQCQRLIDRYPSLKHGNIYRCSNGAKYWVDGVALCARHAEKAALYHVTHSEEASKNG